jgi:hypothetical protein
MLSPLFALPTELRIYIWELSFYQPDKTDLLYINPPSKSLPLTCRQLYGETASMQKAAYQTFWKDTEFNIHLFGFCQVDMVCSPSRYEMSFDDNLREQYIAKARSINTEDLAHISKVTIRFSTGTDTNQHISFRDNFSWKLNDRIWKATTPEPDPLEPTRRELVYCPERDASQLADAGYELRHLESCNMFEVTDMSAAEKSVVKTLVGRDTLGIAELTFIVACSGDGQI